MKHLLLTLLVAINFTLAAQVSSENTAELHLFGDPEFTITMQVIERTKYKYIIDNKKTETPTDTAFLIINNEYSPFRKAFSATVDKLKLRSLKRDTVEISREGNRVYYFFKAVETLQPNLNFEPIAGNIWINNNILVDDYTVPDWAVRWLAYEKKNRMRRHLKNVTNPVTGRDSLRRIGLAFEKVFYYKGIPLTKIELLKKLRREIPDSIAEASRQKYLAIKPEHETVIAQLRFNNVRIAESSKAIKLQEEKIAAADALFEKRKLVFQKLSVLRDSAIGALNAIISLNDHSRLKFPDIDTLTNPGTTLAAYEVNVQREIDGHLGMIARINSDIAQTNRDLKKPDANTELLSSEKFELEQRKIYQDTIVSKLRQLKPKLRPLIPLMTELQNAERQYHQINYRREKFMNLVKEYRAESDSLSRASKNLLACQKQTLMMLSNLSRQMLRRQFKVEKVDIQFTEGFIEDILVSGFINEDSLKYFNAKLEERDTTFAASRQMLKFENRYPIGFSRKRDFENLKAKHLFTIDGTVPKYKLHLEHLIKTYLQHHEINRRDFSPADTVLRVSFDTPATSKHWHQLKKETTYKLFEAKIYSDFVGLDRTQPNGLIQLELDRKVLLITNRFPRKVFKYEMWNFGFLSYIVPLLTLSKVEGNNKELSLLYRDEEINGKYFPQRYMSTLELKRHENFSTGFDFNIALLDIPTFKSTLTLDYGFRYGRVAIIDSLRDYNSISQISRRNGRVVSYGVNTMQFFPRLNWFVRSDERYCFNFSGSVNWYYLRANDFNQVANADVFESSRTDGNGKRIFANVSMQFILKPSTSLKGKLFFRYQYNWQFNYANTGFHQAQVGYSFYILGNQNGKS